MPIEALPQETARRILRDVMNPNGACHIGDSPSGRPGRSGQHVSVPADRMAANLGMPAGTPAQDVVAHLGGVIGANKGARLVQKFDGDRIKLDFNAVRSDANVPSNEIAPLVAMRLQLAQARAQGPGADPMVAQPEPVNNHPSLEPLRRRIKSPASLNV